MSRSHAARMPAHFNNYKHLTVGDVLPDATSKLYKRLVSRGRQKYIPVKDVSKDHMGRELSSYLIHPDFIDKSVIASEEITEHLKPRPTIRVIQYSKIASLRSTHTHSSLMVAAILPKDIFSRTTRALSVRLDQTAHLIRAAYARAKAIRIKLPVIEMYSVGKGLKSRQSVSKKTVVKAGVIALMLTGGVFAYSNLSDKNTPSAVGGIEYIAQPAGNGSAPPSASNTSKSAPSSAVSSQGEGDFTPTPLSPTSRSRVTQTTPPLAPTPTNTVTSQPRQTQSPLNTQATSPVPVSPVIPQSEPVPTSIDPPLTTHSTPQEEGTGGTVDDVVDEVTNTLNQTVDGVIDGL